MANKVTHLVFVAAYVTTNRRYGWGFRVRSLTAMSRRDLWDYGLQMPAGRL